MGVEEQKEEREVLDSIFPEEIIDISETEFRISIILDIDPEDNGGADEPPAFLFGVKYTENYPDEAPDLELLPSSTSPAKHPFFDLYEDRTRLLRELTDTINENLGIAMVFTLVMVLRDVAETLVRDRANEQRAIKEAERAKIEEAENAKFHGTVVTKERFIKWRESYTKELAEEATRKAEELIADDKKKRIGVKEITTGKQLWERGLAQVGKGEEDEDDEGMDALEGVEKMKIEA
ncbi:RWD-domain-containing protein [Microthyrium microscopicum]|uniref:RWD-domain-containing protein n=1 Tax=Microthyrium microscopicum TaxID=703497 RepID=A0A6A6U7S7_9PEZI|nr:RWD-domain-containing protein [Microthyrium microscopicum]